ncbi:hypothetical protein HIM_02305 [Hirsutella minnesotensis 3608]|nr:hypothetical protein HIM_02305 [Hirsutella minnesotensis 3608]
MGCLTLTLLMWTALASASERYSPQVPLQAGLSEPSMTIGGIPFSTRAHWMRLANRVLYQELGTPCPFAAFGTVIVNHTADGLGQLVCAGVNKVHQQGDPSMHGEMAAIRNCSTVLTDPAGRHAMTGGEALAAFRHLSLYTNAESCPMCTSAIVWAGFREYIFGTSIEAMVRKGWGGMRMASMDVLRTAFNPPLATRVLGGVLANETDAYFMWQYDPEHGCPQGCERREGSCEASAR